MDQDLRLLMQSRIFTFGDYSGPAYGCLTFEGDSVVRASFPHERESFYRLQGPDLEFLFADAVSVTARFRLVERQPLLFHGSTVGLANRLYLCEVLSLPPGDRDGSASPLRPPVLINSVPKAGTYFLQSAFQELGYRPTDLHLGNTMLHDSRGLPRDSSIHRTPRAREVHLAMALLPPFLPAGSVTVGHIDDPGVLADFQQANVCLIAVVRDLRSILWSLFRFKLAVVDPLDDADRHWRSCSSHLEKFMGFLAYHLNRDIVHIVNCARTFAGLVDVPVLRYEDLLAGSLPASSADLLERRLQGCGGVPALLAALSAARHRPTPTLTQGLPGLPPFSPAEEEEIRRLIDAVVAGSPLAEVNALFGYP